MTDPIIDDLADMMPDELVAERRQLDTNGDPVSNDFGEPVYTGEVVKPKCRLRGTQRIVRNKDGQQVTSTVFATLDGVYQLNVYDRYTLPARFRPNQPPALMVQQSSDENGPHHEVVYF